MSKVVKMDDIAREAGVSVVSVSKALSGKKGVSEEVRERVLRLAEEMGYERKSRRQVTTSTRTHNIGIIVQQRFLDKFSSFYWALYQQIAEQTGLVNCFSMLEVLTTQDIETGNVPKLMKEGLVEGVVVIGIMGEDYLALLRAKASVPMVFVDFYDDTGEEDFVVSDSYYGAYAITKYLLRTGHRDIAFVGTVLSTPSITDRYYGYSKALMEYGIAPCKEWTIEDRKLAFADSSLFFEIPAKVPTAFVCNSDRTASLVIKTLIEGGYRVPEDISVTGYDNFLYPGLCNIGITTYEVDTKQMAHVAIQILIKKIRGENYKKGIHIVEGRMLVRASTLPRK